jgi:hypothetical protein
MEKLDDGDKMKPIRVNKSNLIDILQKNRDAHKAIFVEAMENFRKMAIETLEENLKNAKSGKPLVLHVNLTIPRDMTREYDRVIKMLNMSEDAEIFLEEDDFQQYVQDDWGWKQQFLHTNSVYSARATSALKAYEDDDE